ncbi:putative plasma glutamate carboxypeptidase [Fimbriimonas ginsengisoli Gsoil 348]|uniref:Carboxypeptidase Q n=2 Tax=Fimbriimonas ginsengisoli TaxID=1005039 RepID=A0A068NXZ1_FIMGI|nr:putative plasma glutamate carboxypeptidase [Fimbriimonas ginsengisoli Gsoil 348]
MAEIRERGKAAEDLAYLSDNIGPRLTGSENLERAEGWMAEKLKEYGAENVHFESYDYPSRWERGSDDYCRLLTQSKRQMTIHAMPWNPATKGTVEAEVVALTGRVDELLKDVDRYKGKIVLLGPINPTSDEKESAKLVHQLNKEVGRRAVAMITSMEHEDGKFTMYGSPYDSYFDEYFGGWPRVPFGFLIREDRSMLVRLLRKGEKIRMALRLGGAITKTNIKERNVVGEIRGSEMPDEVVLVGGHLDSWDLGTGTTDNGTGSIATLETLRVIKKLGLKPKRTIRFVLFSGEEQGSCGAHAYVAAHKDELSKFQAVLIHDLGAGKPTGFTVQGYKEWMPTLKAAMAPLESIGVTGIPVEKHWDSDQDPFVVAGVPGFFLDQDTTDYFASTHHSQTDMLNHVKPEEYLPSIQALAVAGWEFANMADRVPHVKPGKMVGDGKD